MTDKKPPKPKISLLQAVLAGAGVVTLVVIAVLVTQQIVTAEPTGPSELTQNPERQDEIIAARWTETLGADLNLTPEQADQVTKLIEAFRADMKAMRAASTGQIGGQAMQRFMRLQQFDSDILALLDPDQAAQYQSRRQDRFGRIQSLITSPELRSMLPEQGRRLGAIQNIINDPAATEE